MPTPRRFVSLTRTPLPNGCFAFDAIAHDGTHWCLDIDEDGIGGWYKLESLPRLEELQTRNGACDWSDLFDRSVEHCPEDWKRVLIDVIDTAQMVAIGIEHKLALEPTPDLVIGLTRLAIEKHNANTASQNSNE